MTEAEVIATARAAVTVALETREGFDCVDIARADGRWKVSLTRTDTKGRVADRFALLTVMIDDATGAAIDVSCGSLRREPDRRPRWKRKRWWSAAAFLPSLPFLIPLSEGPIY